MTELRIFVFEIITYRRFCRTNCLILHGQNSNFVNKEAAYNFSHDAVAWEQYRVCNIFTSHRCNEPAVWDLLRNVCLMALKGISPPCSDWHTGQLKRNLPVVELLATGTNWTVSFGAGLGGAAVVPANGCTVLDSAAGSGCLWKIREMQACIVVALYNTVTC
jgi:hypothetical protein